MNRILLLAFFIGSLLSCTGPKTQNSEKPNIILILADDMGYGDPGAYNPDSKISTPHIDALADQGMLFTNAHSPGNWCTPSRYGLLTGRYPHRVNISDMHQSSLIGKNQLSLGKLLQRNGYRTIGVGKWHLGFKDAGNPNYNKLIEDGPVSRGFDQFFGIHASLDIPPYYYIDNNQFVAAPTDTIGDKFTEGWTAVQGEFWRGGKIAPEFKHDEVLPKFTNKAISAVREHVESTDSSPFFLYFALPAPHTPWLPTTEYRGKSKAGLYGDFTMMVDDVVGQITRLLNDLDIDENTMVIFTSDNGPVWFDQDKRRYDHSSTMNLRGLKADLWEGSSRIPFIVKWPGKVKNQSRTNALFTFTDLMTTFGAIVGDSLADFDSSDSYDILPVLKNDTSKMPLRESVVVASSIFIKGEWKYIDGNANGWLTRNFNQFGEDGSEFELPFDFEDSIGLFNLTTDPGEARNLASEYPERVMEMKRELLALKETPSQQ